MSHTLDAKRADERAGRTAEAVAGLLLRLKGYRIVARRFRGFRGEVDLIARRGSVLVFVEVKRRPDMIAAAQAVSPRQRARIIAAAEEFIAAQPRLSALSIRFDAILVAPRRFPHHLVDAWRP